MTKPRIVRAGGLWHCTSANSNGHGMSPLLAYKNWLGRHLTDGFRRKHKVGLLYRFARWWGERFSP